MRRWAKRLLFGLVWIVAGVVCLVASAWMHVQTKLAADVARQYAVQAANGALVGTIAVRRIEHLSTRRVRLRDLTIRDERGRLVVRVGYLDARIDRDELLGGTIRFKWMHASNVQIRLLDDGTGSPSLLRAVSSDLPPSVEENAAPELRVDDLRVRRLALSGDIGPLEELREVRGDLRAKIVSGDAVAIRLWRAVLDVERKSGERGQLRIGKSRIAITEEDALRARIAVRVQRDSINASFEQAPDRDSGAPGRLQARIVATPISSATLRALLGSEAARLRAPVYLDARVTGTTRRLSLSLDARAAGGHLRASGFVEPPTRADVQIEANGIAVQRIVVDGPELAIAGSLRVRADSERRGVRVRADLRDSHINENVIPSLRAEAVVNEDHIHLERLDLPYVGEVELAGRIGFDGSADVTGHIRTRDVAREPNLHRMVPDLHGSLDMDLQLRRAGGESDRIELQVAARSERLAIGSARFAHARVYAAAKGQPDHPRLETRISARGIRLGREQFERLSFEARGGPLRYAVRGGLYASNDRRGELVANVRYLRGAYEMDASALVIGIAERSWRGTARGVRFVPGRRVDVGELVLANGAERLQAWGTARLGGGPMQIRAVAQNLDIGQFARIASPASTPIEGKLDASLELDGTERAPKIVLSGALRDARIDDIHVAALAYDFVFDSQANRFDGDIDATLAGGRGTLSATVRGENIRDVRGRGLNAIREGRYQVDVLARNLDLQTAQAQLPALERIGGRLDVHLAARGTFDAPDASLEAKLHRLSIPDTRPFDVELATRYVGRDVHATVRVTDERGALATLEATAKIDLAAIAARPSDALASIRGEPWALTLRTAPRRLDELPRPLIQDRPIVPIRVAANATVAGGGGRTMQATLDASADWLGAPGDGCAHAAQSHVTVRARTRDGQTRVTVQGQHEGNPVLTADVSAATPLDRWVDERRIATIPSIDGRLRVRALDLDRVPYVCETAAGRIELDAEARDLLASNASLEAHVRSNEMILRGADPVRVNLDARAQGNALIARGTFSGYRGELARLDARIPIRWVARSPVPTVLLNERARITAHFDSAPLGLALAGLPAVQEASGKLDGDIRAEGRLDSPSLRGRVRLSNGEMVIVGPGQRFTRVGADIRLHDGWVELARLRATDTGGSVRASGSISLDGLAPRRARVAVDAHRLPVRSEGMVVATITGNASLMASIGETRTDARIVIHRLGVALPEQSPRKIQSLQPHPDIYVRGERSPNEQRSGVGPGETVRIDIAADQPFWVRRIDFATQLTARLTVLMRSDHPPRVTGRVEVERGFFEIMGKRFELERGNISFTGGDKVDPVVDIVAVYRLPARSDTVTIHVTGSVSRPELAFSTTVSGVTTQPEIISLLLTGRSASERGSGSGSQDQATSATASVLAGMTAGVLTMTARRELGDFFPVISIESGEDAFQSGRVRAGFDASSVVPESLTGVVQGVYVEGYVQGSSAGGGRTSQQGGAGGGVKLDVSFPYDLSFTTEFVPPGAVSFDGLWEP